MRRIYGLHDGSGEIRYVGMTVGQLGERRRAHRKVARKGDPTRRGAWIRSVFARGGDIVIVQLARGDWTQAEAWELEREWIARLRAEGADLTNMTSGGGGTRDLPEDLRRQISAKAGAALRGRKRAPHVGEAISEALKQHHREHPETGEKIAASKRGVPRSEETRRRISESRKGIKLSQEHRDAIAARSRGRTHTAETREKIRTSRLGATHSDETREKLRQARTGTVHSAETRQLMSERGKANRQRCTECGFESTATWVARHQTTTGHTGRDRLADSAK